MLTAAPLADEAVVNGNGVPYHTRTVSHERIVSDRGTVPGNPVIRGTRVTINLILDKLRRRGMRPTILS